MLTSVTLTVLFYASVCAYKDVLRIYNGIEDVNFKYPYVVALIGGVSIKDLMCSGSLIAANWVLSAAHCFETKIQCVQYRTSKSTTNATEIERDVIKVILHPNFSSVDSSKNDIGLVLISPVNVTKYGRISSVDYKTLLGHSVVYAGYGFSNLEILQYIVQTYKFRQNQPLRYANAVVTTCNEKFDGKYICLSPKCSYRQWALPGDSGGPLFVDNKIVGVACKLSLPEMNLAFTPVSPYLTWIHDVITKIKSDL